jgi:Acyl-protein synthetase, LuxE
MNKELSSFAARLREGISNCQFPIGNFPFGDFALELFALQFENNSAYRKICTARNLTPDTVKDWPQIPAVPTSLFKELELTSLAPAERTTVFHSSGTTEQKPSRHFHCTESLAVYEASLWENFKFQISNFKPIAAVADTGEQSVIGNWQLAILTPSPEQAPNSSLVHMFEIIRQKLGQPDSTFVGWVDAEGAWTLDFDVALAALTNPHSAFRTPQLVLGTAFSFVHLLDFLAEKNLRLQLPAGSRVMETGGYKNRSRTMPKTELHTLVEKFLGVPRENIFCEYGMSELSSQAYEVRNAECGMRSFQFPLWARVRIISPETGREVADGETGLIRIFDLANVFSVAAIQTDDLGVRRRDGFELIARAQLAEPRGCSLMTA